MPVSASIEYADAQFAILPQNGCAVGVASGAVDMHSAAGLHEALDLAATISDQLIIDMTDLRFIDSSGLSVLLGADRHDHQLSLSLVRPPQIMRKLLHLTGVGDILTIYTTCEEAVHTLTDKT